MKQISHDQVCTNHDLLSTFLRHQVEVFSGHDKRQIVPPTVLCVGGVPKKNSQNKTAIKANGSK